MKLGSKDNILSLAIAFPETSLKVIQRLLKTSEGLIKFAIVCDSVGLLCCRQIFDTLTESQWSQVNTVIHQKIYDITEEKKEQHLLAVYKELLAESMDWEDLPQTPDLFHFLRPLDLTLRTELMKNEDSLQIAFISTCWKMEEFIQFISCLEPQQKKLTLLQMSRLDRLSKENLAEAAQGFANTLGEKLKTLLNSKRLTPPPYPPYPTSSKANGSQSVNSGSRLARLDELKKKSVQLVQELKQMRRVIQGGHASQETAIQEDHSPLEIPQGIQGEGQSEAPAEVMARRPVGTPPPFPPRYLLNSLEASPDPSDLSEENFEHQLLLQAQLPGPVSEVEN